MGCVVLIADLIDSISPGTDSHKARARSARGRSSAHGPAGATPPERLPLRSPFPEVSVRIRQWYQRSDYLAHEDILNQLPRRVRLLSAAVGDGERVLDLGCLGGGLAAGLTGRCTVVGVDLIPEALRVARDRGLRVLLADLSEGLPLADGSFHVVHAGELLEHVFDPLALLRTCHAALRPGGRLLGTVPNIVALGERVRSLLGRPPAALGPHPDAPAGDHIRAFTLQRLQRLARMAGFSGPGRFVGIATGGRVGWRHLKQARVTWSDLIWFEYTRPEA